MLPHTNIQRYIIEKEEFTARCKQLGADVLFKQANNDDRLQTQQLDSLLNAGVAIIVLDPVNRFTAAEMVRKAHRAGVKVISYDRLISNIDVDAFLSFDPWMTGEQMTNAVIKLRPEGTYVILGGDKSDLNVIGIDEGQQKVLKPYIESKKIDVGYKVFIDKWGYDDAFHEVNQYLNLAGKLPDAIVASSDLLAKGAIDALAKHQATGKVLVTGQGGELFACQNIVKGNQLMTVYKPVKKLADLAAELSIKMMKHDDVEGILTMTIHNGYGDIPSQLLVTIPVDSSNIRATIVASGMVSEKDLYGASK
jgi:D-xylose transport system substrate-binding protein